MTEELEVIVTEDDIYRPTLRDRLTRWLLGVNSLGPPDGDGYEIRVREGNHYLEWRHIEDPFITTVVRPSGWRPALAVAFGLYEIEVRVMVDGKTLASVLGLPREGAKGADIQGVVE